MRLAALLTAAVLAAATAPAEAAVYYALQTGQSGGQTQIDEAHTSSWTFSTGANWEFGGGTFTMKEGPATVLDISLSVYLGADATGPLVAVKTFTNAEFCVVHGGNCQSFAPVAFIFATPLSLSANQTYHVTLTSPALDRANNQYFIKGSDPTLTFVNDLGDPIPDGYVTIGNPPPPPPAVPEPLPITLLATGLLGLALLRQAPRPRALRQG